MNKFNLKVFSFSLLISGCVSTPKIPELTASSPVSTEAKEGSVDISAIPLIERTNSQSEDKKDSSMGEMGGMQMNMGTK